ncbi:hypothetical protein ES705_23612 [subsurface metagenome]
MKIDSVPNKILSVLENESRLTINEIFERTKVPEHRKEYHRICIYRLLEAEKIAKDGKRAKEYLYSLKENVINQEKTTDNLVLLMIEAEIDSKEYGVDISEKEIQPSLKRLKESDKIG